MPYEMLVALDVENDELYAECRKAMTLALFLIENIKR